MSKTKILINIAIVMNLSVGVWYLSNAVLIYSKAYAASMLIKNAWQTTLKTNQINKPWSWADTWPVAKIKISAIALDEIVLSGDSGATLAFGPGLSNAGAAAGGNGVKLISAHRDTHFKKLKDIEINDDIIIQSQTGSTQYRVTDMEVVDARTYTIDPLNSQSDLVLATCYPFNSISAGGYERFIVKAERI